MAQDVKNRIQIVLADDRNGLDGLYEKMRKKLLEDFGAEKISDEQFRQGVEALGTTGREALNYNFIQIERDFARRRIRAKNANKFEVKKLIWGD